MVARVSENESVRDVGARWVQHILEIRLETEPRGELDLICYLNCDLVARE